MSSDGCTGARRSGRRAAPQIRPAARGFVGLTAVPSLPLRWAAAGRPVIWTRVPSSVLTARLLSFVPGRLVALVVGALEEPRSHEGVLRVARAITVHHPEVAQGGLRRGVTPGRQPRKPRSQLQFRMCSWSSPCSC